MNERYRVFLAAHADPSKARARIVRFARLRGPKAAAREFGAGLRTIYRLLRLAREGPAAAIPHDGPNLYRHLVAESPDPWRVRRDMVRYARRHGVDAAVREYGTSITTVRRWMRRAKEGPWRRSPTPVCW